MLLDANTRFSNAQAVTTTAPSSDVYDSKQTNPSHGLNGQMRVAIAVDTTATASGSATVTFALQDSADNSSFADVAATGAIAKADLVAGNILYIPVPVRTRRYLRVNYTVATGPLTAGAFTAGLVTDLQSNIAYPN